MMQFREISTHIDCAKGTLITADGTKITRDDYLPRLILADEVIFFASFVEVCEENNIVTLKPKKLSGGFAYRIIGDSDYDGDTGIMFSSVFSPEKSDLENGILAFRIKSNTVRFAEAVKHSKSLKGVFVILAKSVDNASAFVLAKDNFIAENRPYEDVKFEEIPESEIMTKDELQSILGTKAPLKHTHTMAEIIDSDFQMSVVYTAGNGIKIENNVISCTVEPGSADGDFVSQEEFENAIGNINSILDNINGEVI